MLGVEWVGRKSPTQGQRMALNGAPAKDPEGFVHIPGGRDNQVNRDFSVWHAKTVSEVPIDVVAPPAIRSFQVGLQYHCKNCVSEGAQLLTVDLL